MPIHAYAARDAKTDLAPFQYDPAPLGPHDVEIAITHCGICHSDIHLIDNDWQMSKYPLVPGHEIVGVVTAAGTAATHLAEGDRVGIGWLRSACITCEHCKSGHENYCPSQQATCVGHHGGFANVIRVDGRFAFSLPDALPSESAGPLMCAGVTVFNPLRRFDVKPATRVGVIGIGGLGHLAIQFAAALGCEVTAFSSSPDKEADARLFGAARFISSTDAAALKEATGSLDVILSTVHANLDWNAYMALLRPEGVLCMLGVPDQDVHMNVFKLIINRRSVCGSPNGNRTMTREMLEFAARHGILPQVEVVPIGEVNAAIRKVRENRARYRMVLEM